MDQIATNDIKRRIARDNPWWVDGNIEIPEASLPKRVYFHSFKRLALDTAVKRAAVLLGPRRVGKTVMIKQLVADALSHGYHAHNILYASIDAPVYSGMSLEQFIDFMPSAEGGPRIVIFDEIQYLKDWEVHLKDLVDNYVGVKFVATGSAAAALRLKSNESGAGRFSDFMLPPLTFYEFLTFLKKDEELIRVADSNGRSTYSTTNIVALNDLFLDYLNYGGYPEAVLNSSIRDNQDQFIGNDIIDKVLLKDLPNLYGIQDTQQLNRLFSFLAYNAGKEASLENISQTSGINKPTIKKYIEYLESAFLIIKVGTVDDNCNIGLRERNFKIYLNNPSMRSALFSPVAPEDSESIGYLSECAVFSQWQHSSAFRRLRYARWKGGEVDVVLLGGAKDKPVWIGEIKWSDKPIKNFGEQTKSIKHFAKKHPHIKDCFLTTKTVSGTRLIDELRVKVSPTALYCYTVGRNVTKINEFLQRQIAHADDSIDDEEIDDDEDDEELSEVR
ncbi:ATP-binding protein [Mesorhizobium sp. WSM3868]|uniref:ATP-binding protein n=1 Tax=Mesorhizobium sp. WSM3868 TaxID=2029405 RepID=UPI000BAEC64D|nr:ATP-binding protein [Mesorhizobium sp. WSM3868]PBB39189.1 ATPase [Mesorhizobium sp. WSM3868]